MNLEEINNRTKEIFLRWDKIRNEKTKIWRGAADENNRIDADKVNYTELSKLSDEDEKLNYELFRTLKEDAEKQGFMPDDNGPFWKIPDDLEELQELIGHKKMMIAKYPDDVSDKEALKGLEMREMKLLKGK